MTPVLEVAGLTYRLPGSGERGAGDALVSDLTFTVGTGETLVLLGAAARAKPPR